MSGRRSHWKKLWWCGLPGATQPPGQYPQWDIQVKVLTNSLACLHQWYVDCVTVCLCPLMLQVWAPPVGQMGGRHQTLSCCVGTVAEPHCQSGRAATWGSSHPTPSWHDRCSRHECTTFLWSRRSAYINMMYLVVLNQVVPVHSVLHTWHCA